MKYFSLKIVLFLGGVFLLSQITAQTIISNPPVWVIGPTTTKVSFKDVNPSRSSLDNSNPNGASGGRINMLGAAADGSAFYAASEWGGLYKSTDNGLTWQHLNGYLPSATWDVKVDPEDSEKLYATSFYDGRVNSLAGIGISGDGGSSWTLPNILTNLEGFCTDDRREEPSAFGIAIDPENSDHVAIGTNCGLAISTDGGQNFTMVDPTPADPADDIWDVVIHDGGIIDLVGADGHYRTPDDGTTWSTVTSGIGIPGGMARIAVSPHEADVLFVTAGGQIYESNDGGATWPFNRRQANPSVGGRIPFIATNEIDDTSYDLWFGAVRMHRTSCSTPGSGGTAYRCPGTTWSADFTTPQGAHNDSGDILFDPTTEQGACPLLFSCDGGVYYNSNTEDGCQTPSWEQPNQTPHALWLFAMDGVFNPGKELYFGNQDNGTFAWTNAMANSPSWLNADCCDGFDDAGDNDRIVYTVCCYGPPRANRLFKRNPGMTGGGEINNYPPGTLQGFRYVDVVAQVDDDDFVLATRTGVFFTSNIDATPSINWTQLGAATSPNNVMGIKVTRDDDGDVSIFALCGNTNGDGRFYDQNQIWRYDGTTAGGTWNQINPPGGIGSFGIFDVAPRNPELLIASHRNGNDLNMILTEDGGVSWDTLNGLNRKMTGDGDFRMITRRGPTDFTTFGGHVQPTLVMFDPSDENIVVAGAADAGIFLSFNRGKNWRTLTDNQSVHTLSKPRIPRVHFASFAHLPKGGKTENFYLFIGTQGRGVWRLHVTRGKDLDLQPCLAQPKLCKIPELDLGVIIFDCDRPPCIFRDPIDKNCLVKYNCPGCEGTALCPPWFNFEFNGLDPRMWEVGIFDKKGNALESGLIYEKDRMVLTFRPSERMWKEAGGIEGFELGFFSAEKMRPGKFKVETGLTVSDVPFGKFGMGEKQIQ